MIPHIFLDRFLRPPMISGWQHYPLIYANASSPPLSGAGAKAVFLPAYSPDLNPIEMMWSKVKAILRSLEAATTSRCWPRSARRCQW